MCSLLDWFGQQFELTARLVDFVEESPEIAFFICKSVALVSLLWIEMLH